MRQFTCVWLLSTLVLAASPAAGQFDPAIIGSVVATPAAQGGAVGACCLPDLSCEFLSEFECGQIGGSFQGEFSSCSAGVCAPFEACCFTDGSCSMETPTGCFVLGGTPAGSFTSCGATFCPVMAACCFNDQTCADLEVNDCLAMGGTPQAPGSLCAMVSCPRACDPVIIGSVGTPGFFAQGVAVSGTMAYVADGLSGLLVIDVSNPAAPVILGSVVTPGTARGVAVSGTVAYVADVNFGLQVIDVSNPAAPAILGSVGMPDFARDVAVSGSVAYVADFNFGLQVIDVSNPAAPAILGSVITPGRALGVAVSGTVAYVADDQSGLLVIDVSNPAAPVILGSVVTPGTARGVAVSGTVAYVADTESGLQVIDVSNPAAPAILGSVNTPGTARGVAVSGTVRGVAVSGTVAYVADSESGLQVIDVSNPAAPAILGSVITPDFALRVAVSGSVAYVGSFESGLQVCATSECLNNDCERAIPITPGDTSFENVGASTDGPATPECDPASPQFLKDIWFTYQPLTSGTLSFSTCNQADFDTKVAAYTGDCSDLTLLACAENTPGCAGSTSTIEFPVAGGEDVLLRVGSFNNSTGSGTLTLFFNTDEACCYDNGTCAVVLTSDCLASGGTPQGPGTTCATVSCPQPPCGFVNPSFETGDFTGWITQDLNDPFSPLLVLPSGSTVPFSFGWSSTVTDGTFTAFHGFDGDGFSSGFPIKLAQDVTITNPLLTFDWRAAWNLSTFCTGCADRTFDVVIRPAGGGAELARFNILTAVAGTITLDSGQQSSTVVLTPFIGQTVQVCFEWLVPDNISGPAQFQIDNICTVPSCPADVDLNAMVNVTDLLVLLAGWGPNPGHAADFNDDGNVNVTDLLTLLGSWGACP